MFGHGFFGAGYFGPGYWGPGATTPAPSAYLTWGKRPDRAAKIMEQNALIQAIVAAIAPAAFDHFRKDD